MGKYDIELVEQEILKIVQADLPAKIAAINTEKGDTLLQSIDNKNYFNDFYVQELTPSKFIYYGLENSDIDAVRGSFATTWTIFYKILIEDQNNLSTVRKQILRYTRALHEVIEDNSDKISRYTTIPEIFAIVPEDVTDIINETPYKMGGVTLKVIIS